MAKTVTIKSGISFTTLSAAKKHFSAIRENATLGVTLLDPVRSDVIDVYERYCSATGWSARDATEVTVDWDNRKRPHQGYAQSKAFFVVDLLGDKHVFSIDGALEAIAV